MASQLQSFTNEHFGTIRASFLSIAGVEFSSGSIRQSFDEEAV